MSSNIREKSVTPEYIADLARRINSVGPNPIETVLGGRAALIKELNDYILHPDCFVDSSTKMFAEYVQACL